ncbi:MAG: hypothetical protein WC975_05845, partial [Phycisphaerae bacterium]
IHNELGGMGNSDCPCLFSQSTPGRHGQEDLPMPPQNISSLGGAERRSNLVIGRWIEIASAIGMASQ